MRLKDVVIFFGKRHLFVLCRYPFINCFSQLKSNYRIAICTWKSFRLFNKVSPSGWPTTNSRVNKINIHNKILSTPDWRWTIIDVQCPHPHTYTILDHLLNAICVFVCTLACECMRIAVCNIHYAYGIQFTQWSKLNMCYEKQLFNMRLYSIHMYWLWCSLCKYHNTKRAWFNR